MASKVVRVMQDENLNAGVYVAGKGDVSKSTKQGVKITSRRPLGDVSNRGKSDVIGKGTRKPPVPKFTKIIADASNGKGSTKSSDKVQTKKRAPLADVSYHAAAPAPPVQKIQETSTTVAEDACFDYKNEGFLHDHEQCLKGRADSRMNEMADILKMINGPTPYHNLISPPRDTEIEAEWTYMEEIPEDDYSFMPIKQHHVPSPPHSPLLSPEHDSFLIDDCNFQLIGSP